MSAAQPAVKAIVETPSGVSLMRDPRIRRVSAGQKQKPPPQPVAPEIAEQSVVHLARHTVPSHPYTPGLPVSASHVVSDVHRTVHHTYVAPPVATYVGWEQAPVQRDASSFGARCGVHDGVGVPAS
jgi:hypothetical protein